MTNGRREVCRYMQRGKTQGYTICSSISLGGAPMLAIGVHGVVAVETKE